METSIIISFVALIISILSLSWQVYREWKENKPNLIVKFRFAEEIECLQNKNRVPFIEVSITNSSRKAAYINRPLLCFSSGLTYFKRSNNYEYIDYPYKLEPSEKFKTGILLLSPEADGQIHLRKGDALMVNETLMEIKEDATFTGNHTIVPSKNLPRNFEYRDEIVSCYFEVYDTQSNKFQSPEFKIENFYKHINEIRKEITINPIQQKL